MHFVNKRWKTQNKLRKTTIKINFFDWLFKTFNHGPNFIGKVTNHKIVMQRLCDNLISPFQYWITGIRSIPESVPPYKDGKEQNMPRPKCSMHCDIIWKSVSRLTGLGGGYLSLGAKESFSGRLVNYGEENNVDVMLPFNVLPMDDSLMNSHANAKLWPNLG